MLLAEGRVEQRWSVHDARKDRSLADVERARILVEVGLRRRLDAIRPAAVVDGVEVALEDLVLAEVAVDLDGDDHLAQLAVDGAVLGEEVVLDVLLGDRRPTALHVTALERLPDRASDAAGRDAAVAVEVAVLSGCLLYTSDAADERSSVDLGGRRIIKKKKNCSNDAALHVERDNVAHADVRCSDELTLVVGEDEDGGWP